MKINFNCNDPAVAEFCQPKLAKDCLPEWYSTLSEIPTGQKTSRNIKSCLPVNDLLTSGYVLFNSYQLNLQEKLVSFNKTLDIETTRPEQYRTTLTNFQKKQCPISHELKPEIFFKINLDWTITTPPGYSCLIMQPYYLFETRYSIMPAIVDTDKLDSAISVAGFLISKEKIELLPGMPFVQIIPFKRDTWSMNISSTLVNSKLKHFLFNGYKKLFHSKKDFS